MSRFKITVRGGGIELRGYIDGPDALVEFSMTLQEEYGTDVMIVASEAAEDYDPFVLQVPKDKPARGLQQEGGSLGGF